jgi:thiosulfate/3-mercaptopyruvate sulfurtransferase
MRLRLVVVFLLLSAAGANAQGGAMLVSTDWLHQHLHARGLTIIEIGDRGSYEQSHIRGARFVALRDLLVTRDGVPNELPHIEELERTLSEAGVPPRGRIVLYGRDVLNTARAFFTLGYLGRGEDVSILDGGWTKWATEQRPISTGPPNVSRTLFLAVPDVTVLVRLGAMRMLVDATPWTASKLVIVDARSPQQYFGMEAGADIVRPGHLPGAVNVPWQRNLTSGELPIFQSAETLRRIYRDAGVDDGASIVTYCRTGMQASVTYFVLRYLGRDVRLYDGSYAEWSAAPDTMVVGPLAAFAAR